MLRLDEARAFRKAQFTSSLSLRDPAFEKDDNDTPTEKINFEIGSGIAHGMSSVA
jgi:hypothetical protein